MFAKEFRQPTQGQIMAARAKDDADFNAAEKAALDWIKGVKDLGKGTTVGDLAPFHKSAGDVMAVCARAGERGEAYRAIVKNLDDTISAEIIRAMEATSPQDVADVRMHDKEWMALRTISTQPLFCQMARKDGPISEGDQVATLLCESVETVNEMVAIVKVAGMQNAKSWYNKGRVLADQAKKAEFDIPAIEEKLSALQSINQP